MGRAGGGSFSGGGMHSSGGHSIGHSSSGHHVSSSGSFGGGSSRAGAGRSSYSSSSHRGPSAPVGGPRGPVPHRGPDPYATRRRYDRGYNDGYDRGYREGRRSSGSYNSGSSSSGAGLAVLIVVLVVAFICIAAAMSSDYKEAVDNRSTVTREKLDTGNAYINNCIEDELGWFDNESRTEKDLQEFWSETGVQPYIVLKDYDSALATDADKDAWATSYYETEFSAQGREDVCLYVYFAEKDVEGDVGYMNLTEGFQACTVMDSEAEGIFWNQLDSRWYGDDSTDAVFEESFNKTAAKIMTLSKTVEEAKADFMKSLAGLGLAAAAIIAALLAYNNAKKKREREKEKEEATERMLNTPLETFESKGVDDAASDLAKKYEDTNNTQETTN